MASAKEYGYFIKGSKLAIIEKDSALDNDVNSRDYGPDATNVRFKSPLSSVTDGIELEYIYSPKYEYNSKTKYVLTADIHLGTSETAGKIYLSFTYNSSNVTSNFVVGDYVVIRGTERWNGLHKIQTSTFSTNTYVIFETRLNLADTSNVVSGDIYYDISPLKDEDSKIPISEYLSKAVVYYLKAKTAEDQGNFQLRDLMFKEFYRIVEKSDNAKIHTIRKIAPHGAAIR